jgi:hypothetical protein
LRIAPVTNIIEHAIEHDQLLEIVVESGKMVSLYPHRLLILEGELSLIGELCSSGRLVYHQLAQIQYISEYQMGSFHPNYSELEVEGMIHSIRQINGSEQRLVVRFNREVAITAPPPMLTPPYHFFASPYTVINPSGEMIWSATVELSDELCSWLSTMNYRMDLLGTDEIITHFHRYYDSHIHRQISARKKAS